eukprot:520572-Rhodomonas_salina.2
MRSERRRRAGGRRGRSGEAGEDGGREGGREGGRAYSETEVKEGAFERRGDGFRVLVRRDEEEE